MTINSALINSGTINGSAFDPTYRFSHIIQYEIREEKQYGHTIQYEIREEKQYGHTVQYKLLAYDPVQAAFTIQYEIRELKNYGHTIEYKYVPQGTSFFNYIVQYDIRELKNYGHTIQYTYIPYGTDFFNHTIQYEIRELKNYGHTVQYSLYTAFSHRIIYDIRQQLNVGNHIGEYALLSYDPIQVSHKIQYEIRFAASHSMVYEIRGPISAFASNVGGHQITYELRSAVGANAVSLASHTLSYELRGVLGANASNITAHNMLYEVRGAVSAFATNLGSHDITYELRGPVGVNASNVGAHIMKFNLLDILQAAHKIQYNLTNKIAVGHDINYALLDKNPINASHVFRYNLQGATALDITGQPKIVLQGNDIDIIDAHIFKSETSIHWACQVTVAKKEDYLLFQRDQQFTLDIFGETWKFIVDSKELSRAELAGVSMSLGGISPTALFDSPRILPSEIEVTTANELADNYVKTTLLPTATISWNIVDWTIPKGRLGATNTIPLHYAKTIIETVGGVLEATKNGNFNVRKLWKEHPEDMLSSPAIFADISINEVDDIIAVSEQYLPQRTIDKYRLIDIEAYFADIIETVPDPDDKDNLLKLEVRVYPSPFRNTTLLVSTSSGSRARLSGGSLNSRLVEGEDDVPGELVEIVNSEGTVRYPITSISQVIWISNSIGSVIFEPGSNTIRTTSSTEGYGLLYIKYITQFYLYKLEGFLEPEVGGEAREVYPTQLILEDTEWQTQE